MPKNRAHTAANRVETCAFPVTPPRDRRIIGQTKDNSRGRSISILADIAAAGTGSAQPRAVGAARLSGKRRGERTVLGGLHQQGSLKLLFPRLGGTALTAVSLNTAGGITGGDRFNLKVEAASGCHLVLTTQAAERCYRAQPGETGMVSTELTLGAGARLDWLPQETILYNRSALRRSLAVTMADDARALICEPVIFGRAEMGEVVTGAAFRDRITLHRGGAPVFADRTALDGNLAARLAGRATGGGCGAMATVILAAPDAERFLSPARDLMPETGGVSLVRDGLLVSRLLAPDGFELRRSLVPLLERLAGAPLPRTWMI